MSTPPRADGRPGEAPGWSGSRAAPSRPAAARRTRSIAPSASALTRDGRPLYRQLADDLRRRITGGEFAIGRSIPTEAQLSADYRTSRITVRHALALLEQEGLLHREQGRGSFIRPRAIAVGPRRLTSFTEELQERGLRHGSVLISAREVPAPLDVSLDLGPVGYCMRVERVRQADDRAIAHQVTYLPSEFADGLPEALGSDGSLYDFLRSRHALDVDSADETYRVGTADGTAAELLGLPAGSPVFVVDRVGFSGARRVEWTHSVVRGEDYEVHVHLRR
ncbi:transcriptional regulator NagR [soil metagenome]